MIVETYKGCKIRATKGREYYSTRIVLNGVDLGGYTGTPEQAIVNVKATIDFAEQTGVTEARFSPEWYTPGSYELCPEGHVMSIGGQCGHTWCVGHRQETTTTPESAQASSVDEYNDMARRLGATETQAIDPTWLAAVDIAWKSAFKPGSEEWCRLALGAYAERTSWPFAPARTRKPQTADGLNGTGINKGDTVRCFYTCGDHVIGPVEMTVEQAWPLTTRLNRTYVSDGAYKRYIVESDSIRVVG